MVLEGTAYNGVTRAKNINKKELGTSCLCYTNRKTTPSVYFSIFNEEAANLKKMIRNARLNVMLCHPRCRKYSPPSVRQKNWS